MSHDGPIHDWFGLTYASYLVLPRSVLQEMPLGWQKKFVALLEEVQGAVDPELADDNYAVQLRDRKTGRFKLDPLRVYRRPDQELMDRVMKRGDPPSPPPRLFHVRELGVEGVRTILVDAVGEGLSLEEAKTLTEAWAAITEAEPTISPVQLSAWDRDFRLWLIRAQIAVVDEDPGQYSAEIQDLELAVDWGT